MADFIPHNSDDYDYRSLLSNNCRTMCALLRGDPATRDLAEEYRRVAERLPPRVGYDTPLEPLTRNAALLAELRRVVYHKDDLAPVRAYLMRNAFRYAD